MAKDDEAKRLGDFLSIAPVERNNPESLRRLLFDLIWCDFDTSITAAAERFRTLLRESKDPRKFRTHGRGLSKWPIYRVTRDEQPITYSQLDGIAQHLGIPMALVLLFSRVRSEVELADGHDTREAIRVLTAVKSAIQELEKILNSLDGPIDDVYKSLSHDQLKQFRDAYLAKFSEMRSTLL